MNAIIGLGVLLTQVFIGGDNIGFGLKPDGLIVTGTYDIVDGGKVYNPRHSDIRVGDIITKMDGYKVTSLGDVAGYLSTVEGDEVVLTLKRGEALVDRALSLIAAGDKRRTGLYVKERVLGIGTVSYYDPSTQTYGALGHPVKDAGGKTFELSSGAIYLSSVQGIKPSTEDHVGEKVATIDTDHKLGTVAKNTDFGIVGSYVELPEGAVLYDVAKPAEVKLGKAKIYTVIEQDEKDYYEIEITKLKKQSSVQTKGITFKVTDEELIAKTGGIVAGMSGSPIVQGGKLIGAVTHVIVSDPLQGYGIYLDSMIKGLS